MSDLYVCKFEDHITKHKLPKGLSYVLQTTDITQVLSTDGLAITYNYRPDNPSKKEKSFSFTNVNLLSYSKHGRRLGEPGSVLDYDSHLSVYSVPAKLRKPFRTVLIAEVLPRLKAISGKANISVYYKTFNKSNWEPLDWGGLYIEKDRYRDKAKVLYRNTELNLDDLIKECKS